ncbi:MAG: SUMF1/EgtB/PvdO family nonheme iron enzyme [Terriglobia bacterium]|nr:SUMF1/EgtB/PvdO family nonheme iron enzyme [Terriglobia bacterium]
MGSLFISHSSKDNHHAIRIRDWLNAQGWADIFLDLDPNKGLATGQLWQEELRKAGENCAAVILLISPNWIASTWCQTEFLLAEQFGKRIFPVLIAPTPRDTIRPDLRDKYQIGDISNSDVEKDGLDRLAFGLRRAGLDPQSFPWPPPNEPERPVYRGLQSLDVPDAAIFFGRDAPITRGLDELRRLRAGAAQNIMVILGASGAGKSSFMRAGLISRLLRDDLNFIVLPILRPGSDAPRGLQGLIAGLSVSTSRAVTLSGGAGQLAMLFADLRAPVVDRLERHARAAGEVWSAKPPTVVIPIDQAEELFNAENADYAEFRDQLKDAITIDGNVLIILTIRTQSYEALQSGWMPEAQYVFTLPPISPGSFQEVIEGPAKLAVPPVTVEPGLTQALLADLQSADELPLLAFTMERLQAAFGKNGRLTLEGYQSLGGIAGAIKQAIAQVIRDSSQVEILARRLFIPALIRVDAEGVKRRIARKTDIPREAWGLAGRFVEQRLLVSDRQVVDGVEVETLEIAHEAVFRQWPALAGWIAEEQGSLRALESVRAAAKDWQARRAESTGQHSSWLIHNGERLQEARAIISRKDFRPLVTDNMRDYIDAAWRVEHRSLRVRRFLQITAVVLGAAVVAGSLIYALQFELKRAWAQVTMAHLIPHSETAHFARLKHFTECNGGLQCPEMVVLDGGQFVMGSPKDEKGRFKIETSSRMKDYKDFQETQRTIHVKRFAIGETDVTFDQWNACVDYTKQEALLGLLKAGLPQVGCGYVSDSGFGTGNRPVINVSWEDAKGYVRWLNLMLTGDPFHGPYRLPSEAEWEYAARGGTATAYFWGDSDDAEKMCKYANFATAETKSKYPAIQAAPDENEVCRNNYIETSPVGSFLANPFQLYDVSGNVYQWVEDCIAPYDLTTHNADAVEHAAGVAVCDRALRGGSWRQAPHSLRSASRGGFPPTFRSFDFGFRVARDL